MLTVKQYQRNLVFLGYECGGIDGIKGAKTTEALRQFQSDYGLLVDGIYGKQTEAKLIEIIKEEQGKLGVEQDGIVGQITENAKRNEVENWDKIIHFKKEEFTCKCGCGLNNINLELVEILEKIRSHFGGNPIIITSGCRCTKHNLAVQGAKYSRHVDGKASDLYVRGITTSELLNYCKELVNQGVLRYTYTNDTNMRGVVHIDIK